MPSVGRRKMAKVTNAGNSNEKNRKQVIVIEGDEEEEVSETSNSSDSDYISISEEDDEERNREVGNRPEDAPRIRRFTRGRNEVPDAHQGNSSSQRFEVEDSESDCEVLSAREWNEMFSKGKPARTGKVKPSLGKTPRKRGFSVGTGDPMSTEAQLDGDADVRSEMATKSLGTTLRSAKHSKTAGASKVEVSSPVLNGSAAIKNSSSPGLRTATPDRVRKEVAGKQSPSAQTNGSRGSSERPVKLPRPVSAGAPPRKAPHIVHSPETGPVSKAAQHHTAPGDASVADGDKPSEARGVDNETRRESVDVTNKSESATVLDRETRRQSAEFREAEKLEWAARQSELQKQALEVQKEKERLKRKRKEAEKQLEMQSRQKQRVLEMREYQKKEEQVLEMKEELRGVVHLELEQRTAGCTNMGSLLQKLGILGACSPSVEQVIAGYKKALKTFHPDRTSGSSELRRQVEAEETFKLISRMKSLLPLTTVHK